MYGVPADLERSLRQERPGPVVFNDATSGIDAVYPDSLASGLAEADGQKSDFDPDIDPGIAFLGGFGISRRALYLASRVAVIRGTTAHDELIAADVLGAEEYWIYLAAYLGLPFVTGNNALAMSPTARFVPS